MNSTLLLSIGDYYFNESKTLGKGTYGEDC